MGRGNIVITDKHDNPKLFFYTHWEGSRLPEIVRHALSNGQSRWGDPSYLNRILFQTMLGGDDSMLGFGIDIREGDGGVAVYINHDMQTVTIDGLRKTFSEYIATKT